MRGDAAAEAARGTGELRIGLDAEAGLLPVYAIFPDGAYELKLALAADAARPAGHFHADGTFHEGED